MDLSDLFSEAPAAAVADPVASATPSDVSQLIVRDLPPATKKRAAKHPLFFDIETVPDDSRKHLFGLDPLPSPVEYLAENNSPAPSELLRGTIDEVKAAISKAQSAGKMLPVCILTAAIAAEQKAAKPRKGVIDLLSDMVRSADGESDMIAEATASQIKKMSVTPEFLRVVSIGWAVGKGKPQSITVGHGGATERDCLEQFWSLAAETTGPVVGYNVCGFDLPALFMRSAILGVDPTRKLDLTPWKGNVCDLMQCRWPRGGAMKLKDLARLLGIEVPAGDIEGSQVYQLWHAGEYEKIAEYVQSDVAITQQIHAKFSGLFC